VNAEIARHTDELGACMRSSGKRRAQVSFNIRGSDGRVTSLRVDGSESGKLHDCLWKVTQKMRFPRTGAGRTVAQFEMSR
jgi:hypothetical protein